MALFWDSLTIPPAGNLNNAGQGAELRQLAAAGARSVLQLVYGEDRIGALVLNVLLASGGGTLLVQCMWGFASDSINDVRLNDQALPAGATLVNYTGAQTTVDSTLAAAFSAQGITYTQSLTGYAYSVLSIPTRLFDGALNITARIRGRKVYDPRLDSTRPGGSGGQRVNNTATWLWSDNPALALADFLASSTYGAGVAPDWDTLSTAANACDELIGSPSEKRRLLGVSFGQATDVGEAADALRAYAGCWLLPTANGVRLLPDAATSSVASYSHASGEIADLQPLQLRDLGAIPTQVDVVYTDTSRLPWRDATATASLSGAGITRPLRISQVRMPGVQRYSQALREATERLNKLALQDLSTGMEVFDIGIRHEVGDVVTVTHPAGLASTALRVTAVNMPAPGRWRLALVRYSASAYSNSVVTVSALSDPGRTLPPGPPAVVSGLSATVGQGIITWAWTAATERDWAETRLRLGGTDWASAAPLWAGRATGYLQRVTATGTYTLRARHALDDGQESATTAAASVTVTTGDLVQSEPGSPGLSQANAELYQWGSSSQPSDPNGTSTWTWATLAHSAYSGGNGWGVTVGSNPGTAGARLWVARKGVSAAAGTAASSVSWTGGFTVFAASLNGDQGPSGGSGTNGSNGANGLQYATPTVFQWAASIPTGPTGGATYTWASGSFGSAPSGWALTPGTSPSAGFTLWAAAVALVDSAVNPNTGFNWTSALITARGYAGTQGPTGATGPQGPQGPQGPSGTAAQQGASARIAYAKVTGFSLASTPVTTQTSGSTSFPATNTWGGGESWQGTVPSYNAGESIHQIDGIYQPGTDITTWGLPYLAALKVGSLSAITVNTGNLSATGTIVVSASGDVRSSNYSAGAAGWYLGPTGAELPAAAVRGQLTASQINANGLVIRDALGNAILGAGVALPIAYAASGTVNSDLVPSINSAANTALWGSVSSRPSNLAALGGGEVIRNDQITITTGVLSGIGTSGVVVDNSAISLSPTGALNGGGGGQIQTTPVIDRDREIDRVPSWYPTGTTREFKHAGAIGLNDAFGYWLTLETIKQFGDGGGGFPGYQYAYQVDKTWRRRAANDAGTAWTAWVQDLDRAAYTGDLDATLGARAGVNLLDSAGAALGDAAIKNSAITVDAATGNLLNIGTTGVQVDNRAAIIGQNLCANSDQTTTSAWSMANVYNGAEIYPASGSLLFASGPWTTANYALAAGRLRNVFISQIGRSTGSADPGSDGFGNTVAADVVLIGEMPVIKDQRVCASVFLNTLACRAMIFIAFRDAAGVIVQYPNFGAAGSFTGVTNAGANNLANYERPFLIATVPAGVVSASILVRKYNTIAGNGASYVWIGGSQFEPVGALATGPSPYTSGPASDTRQLGYTGDLNATLGAPSGTPMAGTFPGGTTASTVEANAATALSQAGTALATRLARAGDTITGRINLGVADGLFAGTDLNNGVYLGSGGLVGKKAGAITLAVGTDGSASFAGNLAAATGSFVGETSVAGATYASGTGFWAGIDAGSAKMRVGSTTQYLRWTGTRLEIKLETVSVSISGTLSTAVGNGTQTYGALSASASGGTAPYTYIWDVPNALPGTGTNISYGLVGSLSGTSLSVQGTAVNDYINATIRLTVRDANGQQGVAYLDHYVLHGLAP